ncbi:MAG: gamma-glutamylcyclotransferase family protein [Terriglobales bacterium]
MPERRIDSFFYGLFMDVDVLRRGGAAPVDPRRAYVEDFALRIGARATLVALAGARAYGMLIALTHAELERLYGAPGLDHYRPEAVLARLMGDDASVPALCYNLRVEPSSHEANPDYTAQLQRTLRDLGFPAEYINSITPA